MDEKRNGKTVAPEDAAAYLFRETGQSSAQARDRMLRRMGLERKDQDSEAARRAMIDRQTRRK